MLLDSQDKYRKKDSIIWVVANNNTGPGTLLSTQIGVSISPFLNSAPGNFPNPFKSNWTNGDYTTAVLIARYNDN